MYNNKCKLHLGGSASPCGGQSCKTCIPFISFKITLILLAGLTIGTAGMMLVESNPAAELLRGASERNTQRTAILQKLTQIDRSVIEIKHEMNSIKTQIGVRY